MSHHLPPSGNTGRAPEKTPPAPSEGRRGDRSATWGSPKPAPPVPERHLSCFESSDTASFVMTADLVLIEVNPAFEQLTGVSQSRLSDPTPITDLFHGDDRASLLDYCRRENLGDDLHRRREFRLNGPKGKTHTVHLQLQAVPGSSKIVGSFTDITRLRGIERKYREQEALLEAVVDGFEGFIYVAGADYRIRFMNRNAVQRFGGDPVGMICYEALYGRRTPCPFCVLEQVLAGERVRFDVKDPRDRRWYYSANAPIHHLDGTVSLLAMVTDVHDRKLAETQLRQSERILRKENLMLRSSIKKPIKFGGIVGRSAAMQAVYEQILNAAASDANAIIYGEPGTGKELVAHAIHDMSERRDGRVVPVHCGAIPENLFESEFFGYKRGAFSGADANKEGYLDYADGGTLFLDEVGEISLHMQVKLLRAIEGGGYTPVGSNVLKRSNVRIIAATNRNMQELVKQGKLREDFFYRVHILPVYLPPLRERKDDIPLLVDHFVRLYGGKQNIPPIAGSALDRLIQYDWPGNVRELQNVVVRYCAQKTIDLIDSGVSRPLPPPQSQPVPQRPRERDIRALLDAYERSILLKALRDNQWHRNKVADLLGIDRKTLFNKMKRHNLIRPS